MKLALVEQPEEADKMPTAASPAEIPNLADLHPPYAAALAVQQKVWAERTRLQAEERELDARLASLAESAGGGNTEQEHRVAVLLGEAGAADAPESHAALRGKRADVRAKLRDVELAVDRVKVIVERERGSASLAFCEAVRSAHDAAVRRIAEGLLMAHAAHFAYAELVDRFEAAGAYWSGSLRPMQPTMLGHPRDHQSRVALWMREAITYGFVDPAQVPDRLRLPPSERGIVDAG